MKKLLTLITVLVLISLMPVVLADTDTLTLFDFGATNQSNINAGDGVVTVGEGQTVSYKTPGAPGYGYGSLAFEPGKLNITLGEPGANGNINMIGLYGTFGDAFKTNYSEFSYIRYYIKNGSSVDVKSAIYLFETQVESASRVFPKAESITTYDMNGDAQDLQYADWSVVVPAGFEGYVFLKLDYENWDYPSAWSHTKASFDNIACAAIDLRCTGCGAEDVVTYGNMELVMTETIPATVTEPTEAPTDEPTEQPTEQPSETADVSTLAFALAALTGCGALVIRKKK